MDKKELVKMEALGIANYNRPYVCQKCGGMMVFKGVGEYECENCRNRDYDDYGKTRNYLEKHPGANTAEISEKTGVSQKSIRQMLKESRLEIASDSKTFMKCEICGVSIRHGTLCEKCEVAYNRNLEERMRANRDMSGFGMDTDRRNQKGEKRFTRDEYGIF